MTNSTFDDTIQFSGADGNLLLLRVRALADAIERCISGGGPSPEELLAAPILTEWAQIADVCPVLRGSLSVRLGVIGRTHTTREMMVYAPEAGWARTLSGLYRLGPQFDDGTFERPNTGDADSGTSPN